MGRWLGLGRSYSVFKWRPYCYLGIGRVLRISEAFFEELRVTIHVTMNFLVLWNWEWPSSYEVLVVFGFSGFLFCLGGGSSSGPEASAF